MRKIFTVMLLIVFFAIGCDKRAVIDRPIIANNFNDLLSKIDSACANLSKNNCDHIWALVKLSIPNAKNNNYHIDTQNSDEVVKAEALFQRLNQKTPRELLLIYKSDMMDIIQNDINKDKEISANLDNIYTTHKRTERFLRSFQIKDIKNTFGNATIKIMLSIFNYSKYNIKQINGKVYYYEKDNITVAVSDEFSYKFNPDLMANERLTLLINIDMKPENIKKIRAIKDIKTSIVVQSMLTDNNDEPNLIFILPESYDKMRALLEKSKTYQIERINLINSISTE